MIVDPRRHLMSASRTQIAAECPGSVALEKEVRQTGRFFELPDRARTSGIKIHEALALQTIGKDTNDLELDSEERATLRHCIELRETAIAAWQAREQMTNNQTEIIVERRFWYRRGLFPLFSGQ